MSEEKKPYIPKNIELSVQYQSDDDVWRATLGEQYNHYNAPLRFEIDMSKRGSKGKLTRWLEIAMEVLVDRIQEEQGVIDSGIVHDDHEGDDQ